MVGKPLSKGDIGDIKMPRPCRNGVVGYYNGKSLEMSMARGWKWDEKTGRC
jgi:hypothetical protein